MLELLRVLQGLWFRGWRKGFRITSAKARHLRSWRSRIEEQAADSTAARRERARSKRRRLGHIYIYTYIYNVYIYRFTDEEHSACLLHGYFLRSAKCRPHTSHSSFFLQDSGELDLIPDAHESLTAIYKNLL